MKCKQASILLLLLVGSAFFIDCYEQSVRASPFLLMFQVWSQMLSSGIRPDLKNYNMLLRTARECGIGNPSLTTRLLLGPDWKHKSERVPQSGDKEVIDIDFLERQLCIQSDPLSSDSQQDSRGSEDEPSRRQDSTHLIPVRQTVSLPVDLAGDCAAPNLLDIFEGKTSTVISLSAVKGPSDRLALIGGATGLLEKMEVNGLSPDLRTLTLLADMMEPGYLPLQVLLKAAKKHQVKLDVAFFNSAVRRAARADDMEGATVRTQSQPSLLFTTRYQILNHITGCK